MATPVLQGADIRASNIIGSTITATTLNVPTLSVANLTVPGTVTAGTLTSGGTVTGNAIVSTTTVAATGAVTAASVAATGAVTAASVTATGTVTGQKVVGTFGTTSGLTLPVAPIWVGVGGLATNAYAVGEQVVSDIGGGVLNAFQCLVAQNVGAAAPAAGANWQLLAGPFTANLQCGRILFKATEQVVAEGFTMGLYIPGMVADTPVFITGQLTDTQAFSARSYVNFIEIKVGLNGAAAADCMVYWFTPTTTA
jgi:hypothetical protein